MSFKKPTETEEEARKRLELISLILFDDLLGMEESYLEGSKIIILTWADTIQDVNNAASAYGMPGVSAGDYEATLDRALNDYRSELGDLKDDYDGATDRINKTVWFVTWTTYDNAVLDIARQAGYTYVEWRTQRDESVCPICIELEGVYRIEDAPSMPAHVLCRCWWTLPEAQRDALDTMHTRYMAKLQGL